MTDMIHELRREGVMLAYLDPRPPYCDRGRWKAGVEVVGLWQSENDPWPRYYFDLERGKAEVEAYLAAKKVPIDGAAWAAHERSPEVQAFIDNLKARAALQNEPKDESQ